VIILLLQFVRTTSRFFPFWRLCRRSTNPKNELSTYLVFWKLRMIFLFEWAHLVKRCLNCASFVICKLPPRETKMESGCSRMLTASASICSHRICFLWLRHCHQDKSRGKRNRSNVQPSAA